PIFDAGLSLITQTSLFRKCIFRVKAGWNYALVEGDGSLGIHNPTYVLTILNNTLYQLNQLP
ncbi:MAG: hypothetical protein ACP5QW_09205, partial [bacterium]